MQTLSRGKRVECLLIHEHLQLSLPEQCVQYLPPINQPHLLARTVHFSLPKGMLWNQCPRKGHVEIYNAYSARSSEPVVLGSLIRWLVHPIYIGGATGTLKHDLLYWKVCYKPTVTPIILVIRPSRPSLKLHCNDLPAIQLLVGWRADVNLQARGSDLPLVLAVKRQRFDLVKCLLALEPSASSKSDCQ